MQDHDLHGRRPPAYLRHPLPQYSGWTYDEGGLVHATVVQAGQEGYHLQGGVRQANGGKKLRKVEASLVVVTVWRDKA